MNSHSKFAPQKDLDDQDQKNETNIKKPRICYKKCKIRSCNHTAASGFTSFPKKEFLRNKWLKACGLKEEDLKKSDVICFDHFYQADFIPRSINARQQRLKLGAVPRINLPKVPKVKTSHFPENFGRPKH